MPVSSESSLTRTCPGNPAAPPSSGRSAPEIRDVTASKLPPTVSRHRTRTSPDVSVQDSAPTAGAAMRSAAAAATKRRRGIISALRTRSDQARPSTSTVTISTSGYFWCRTELA